MKKPIYDIRQGLGGIKSFRYISLLLFVCYTVGFLFPLMVWSYRDGMIDSYAENPVLEVKDARDSIGRYMATGEMVQHRPIEVLTPEYFNTFVPEGVRITVRVYLYQHVFHGDFPITADPTYLIIEEDPVFMPFYYDMKFLAGRPIENDGEIIMGSGALPKGTVYEKVLGDIVQIGKGEYVVCGVIEETNRVFLSMNVLDNFYSVHNSINLSVPNMSNEEYREIANVFKQTFPEKQSQTAVGRNDLFIDAAKQIGDELFPYALVGLIFCCANGLALVIALLSMKKRDILIRMSLGATPIDIFVEQLTYIGLLSLAAAAAAYLLALGIAHISVSLGIFRLLIQPGHIAGLLGFSLALSAITSAWFAFSASRLNLGSVGRSV